MFPLTEGPHNRLRSVQMQPKVGVRLIFHNDSEKHVGVSWADANGKERPYFVLGVDLTREISTQSGHCWVVRSSEFQKFMCTIIAGKDAIQQVYVGTLNKDVLQKWHKKNKVKKEKTVSNRLCRSPAHTVHRRSFAGFFPASRDATAVPSRAFFRSSLAPSPAD
eukprot:FR739475.1.p1 GENE.FR739475.1~~FR739475.1.p1  ORF type:complete len:164 (-),score=9.04 FR739475.1:201-692(-)